MENLTWLVQDRVVYWKFKNTSTMRDLIDTFITLNRILANAQSKIHIIIDARQAQPLHKASAYESQITRKIAKNPQMGCCAVVSHDYFFRHQMNRLTVDFGTRLRYANTYRDAWKSLQTIDSSLPYVAPQVQPVVNAKR